MVPKYNPDMFIDGSTDNSTLGEMGPNETAGVALHAHENTYNTMDLTSVVLHLCDIWYTWDAQYMLCDISPLVSRLPVMSVDSDYLS